MITILILFVIAATTSALLLASERKDYKRIITHQEEMLNGRANTIVTHMQTIASLESGAAKSLDQIGELCRKQIATESECLNLRAQLEVSKMFGRIQLMRKSGHRVYRTCLVDEAGQSIRLRFPSHALVVMQKNAINHARQESGYSKATKTEADNQAVKI